MIGEALIITAAYAVDLAVGDPRFIPHPVRIIGGAVHVGDKALRRATKSYDAQWQKAAGAALVFMVVWATFWLTTLVNRYIPKSESSLDAMISTAAIIWLTSTTLATRGLVCAGRRVIREVKRGNIDVARKQLAMIVGRDTAALSEEKILAASIETVAENASDGIIAPMFYFALGGLPLAMAYKAVNTMDSMLGYRNEEYRHFGWAAARLDDAANFIPARITALLIAAAALFVRRTNARTSFKIMRRDGRNHASPNSGVPEAAMAGALGVRLGGPSSYGGKVVIKPYIGDDEHDITVKKAKTAVILTAVTSLLGFAITLALAALEIHL